MIEPIPNLNREKTKIKLILKINEIIEQLNKMEKCDFRQVHRRCGKK